MKEQPFSPRDHFRRMVVLGDSIAYGMCAGQSENEWAQVVARLIRTFSLQEASHQDEPLEVLNRGLPAEVISPGAPGYEESAKPSLIERYRQHCIALGPDLVIIAEGLNDMRSGMAVQDFMADLSMIVSDIRNETGALVVLLGVYHQTFGCGANDPETYATWTRWDHDIAGLYNQAIRLVAARTGALFVDVLHVMGGADWFLNPDCCHLNDLGHVVVGEAVFETIARHCPGMGIETARRIRDENITIANSGGANTDAEIRALWESAAERFGVSGGAQD